MAMRPKDDLVFNTLASTFVQDPKDQELFVPMVTALHDPGLPDSLVIPMDMPAIEEDVLASCFVQTPMDQELFVPTVPALHGPGFIQVVARYLPKDTQAQHDLEIEQFASPGARLDGALLRLPVTRSLGALLAQDHVVGVVHDAQDQGFSRLAALFRARRGAVLKRTFWLWRAVFLLHPRQGRCGREAAAVP